jgi:hypothetical protein
VEAAGTDGVSRNYRKISTYGDMSISYLTRYLTRRAFRKSFCGLSNRRKSMKKPPLAFPQAGSDSGGGGNCTRIFVSVIRCPQYGYALSVGDAQDMCREDEALRELVACWHHVTSDVRVTIMEIARSAR